MDDINFNSDKLVIMTYQRGAGGKFLINCLGLSKDAVLQDKDLAQKDLEGTLTPEDKFNLLIERINKIEDKWNDLGLGCYQLLGVHDQLFRKEFSKEERKKCYRDVVKLLSNSNKLFFIVQHRVDWVEDIVNEWPNAKVVAVDHSYEFARSRPGYHHLESGLDDMKNEWVDQIPYDADFRFNANEFNSKHHTLKNIQKLYKTFGLTDYNEEYISLFYDAWFQKVFSVTRR